MTTLPSGTYPLEAIVLGRAGLDLYPTPAGTKTRHAAHFRSDLGGSAGNIAVALQRLGLRTGLIAPVSADPAGDFVKTFLQAEGIAHLTPEGLDDGSRTSLAIAETRTEDCEVVIYRNQAADLRLTLAQVAALELTTRAPILIATGTALALEPSRSATLAALAATPYAVLDLDYRAYTWASAAQARATYAAALQRSKIVVGNEEEFALLADGKEPLAQARALAPNHDLIVYKRGAQGAIALSPDGQEQTFGVFDVAVLKPFGAGDAFMGGLISRLQKGAALDQAVPFAAACAALVVSRTGCASAMPTQRDVLTLMESQVSHAHSPL